MGRRKNRAWNLEKSLYEKRITPPWFKMMDLWLPRREFSGVWAQYPLAPLCAADILGTRQNMPGFLNEGLARSPPMNYPRFSALTHYIDFLAFFQGTVPPSTA